MAQKRMFSLRVVDTDAFCEMPSSAQNLYFHIGMRADDEGFFAGVKGLMAKIHSGNDDLTCLLGKGFLLDRGDGVYVVKHWKMNNYIPKDRFTATEYAEKKIGMYEKEDGSYTLHAEKGKCIQNVYADKVSISRDLDKKQIVGGAGGLVDQEISDEEVKDTADKFKGLFPQGGK